MLSEKEAMERAHKISNNYPTRLAISAALMQAQREAVERCIDVVRFVMDDPNQGASDMAIIIGIGLRALLPKEPPC